MPRLAATCKFVARSINGLLLDRETIEPTSATGPSLLFPRQLRAISIDKMGDWGAWRTDLGTRDEVPRSEPSRGTYIDCLECPAAVER